MGVTEVSGATEALPAVLIVDDRAENLTTLAAVLEDLPIRLVRATSGGAAIACCESEEFAVVILDVMMPDTDGLATARVLKSRAASRLTPIIFLTAMEADRRRVHDGYASGAVDYLFKPVDPDVLRSKVSAFVDLYRHRRADHWQQRRRYADQAAAAAAAAVRAGDERFRLLAESAPVMVWTATPDGHTDYTSPFTMTYVGGGEDVADDRWIRYVHPDDRTDVAARWAEAVRLERTFETDVRIWNAERQAYRRHVARAVPRRDAAGTTVGWVGVNADVEDTKRGEEEAHALRLTAEREARIASDDARVGAEVERKRLSFLLDAGAALAESLEYRETLQVLVRTAVPFLADFAMVDMVDEHARVERVAWAHADPAKERLIRSSAAALPLHGVVGTMESRIVPGVDPSAMQRIEGNPDHQDVIRALGITSTMTVPLVARGRTLGVMLFCMSESRRRFDAPDLALAEELVRRAAVAVDTARLYEAAHEANRAKAAFLAAVSHDLRQPLNASLGFLDIALMGLRGDVPSTLRGDLERVRRNQQHLLALINDVLSFARIEAGQLTVRRERIALDQVLDVMPSLVSPQADAKGVTLRIEPADPSVSLVGDHERVLQILTNLVTNAIKATPAGGRIWIDSDAGPDVVQLHVHDSGIGIAPEMCERIFEPFVQVSRSLNRPEEGIGLGLAISRNLTRAMGGELSVRSTPGAGSVFTLRLPRAGGVAPPLHAPGVPARVS